MIYKNALPSKSQKTKSASALSGKTAHKKSASNTLMKKKLVQKYDNELYDIIIKGLKSEIEILENTNKKLRQLSCLK